MKKKRFAAMALALAMLTVSTLAADRTAMQPAAETALEKRADTLWRSGSAEAAFEDLLLHGFLDNGAEMKLTDKSALTATLFGSEVLSKLLEQALADGAALSMELNAGEITLSCTPTWRAYGGEMTCVYTAGNTLLMDSRDNAPFTYRGATNDCDTVLRLLCSDIRADLTLRRTEVREETAVFDVEIRLADDFDFNGDYTAIAPQSETLKELFRYAGKLLGYMGLDPFHWSYTTSMTLEVPYECSHSVDNHRWISEDGALVSIGGTGYAVNALQAITGESLTGGSYTYYRLASPVHLSPTEEWVVEIESTGLADIALSPLPSNRAALSALVLNTNLSAVYATASTFEAGGAAFHFAESSYRGEFRYHPDHAYTVYLENRFPADEWDNMVYVTVYDRTLDKAVYGPAPLTDAYVQYPGDTSRTPEGETDALSGQEFIISYIGNRSTQMTQLPDAVRIYPMGKEYEGESAFVTSYVNEDCTKEGGVFHTCTLCGYHYITSGVAAAGHSYGDYLENYDATCTENGTVTARCTRCGVSDTRPSATVLATGHSWDEGTVTMRPRTDRGGVMVYTCLSCGQQRHEAIEALPGGDGGHDHGSAPSDTDRGDTSTGGAKKEPTPLPPLKAAFTDVLAGDYFADAVLWAVEQDIATGISYNTFDPHALCTRAQVLTFIHRAHGSPAPHTVANPFTDISPADYYYDAALWACEMGLVEPSTLFSPDAPCQRAEAVTYLHRAAGSAQVDTLGNPFTDIAPADACYNAVAWALKCGITGGTSPTTFSPADTCSRAQVMTFLYRAYH